MSTVLGLAALVLLLTLALGLLRVWMGPGRVDRMLAAQLLGTTGVALLLIFAELQESPALRDVALTLAMLAVLITVAFVARALPPHRAHPEETGHDSD